MKYKRVSRGFKNYKLYPETYDINELIEKAPNEDYYESLYNYTEEHYNYFTKNNTVAGITDVKTDKIVFDFDDNKNIENARKDALTVSSKLLSLGLNQDDFRIFFSGNKGFHIEIALDTELSRPEFENILKHVGAGLTTLDTKIVDEQRIFRIPLTKHQKTGLYKIPLSLNELSDAAIEHIQKMAQYNSDEYYDALSRWKRIPLPQKLQNLTIVKPAEVPIAKFDERLDLSRKPKWLSATKYALQEGFFKEGERNNAFMILAATYRANGFPKEIAWRMLKGVAELQAKRNQCEQYCEKALWKEVIIVVYSEHWKGGTYSEKETELLKTTANRFNLALDSHEKNLININNLSEKFTIFAQNIDKNRIKTGIDAIDKRVLLTTGMSVGILAAPGGGKTSFANSFARYISSLDLRVLYESLDMSENLLYCRLLQKYCPYSLEKITQLIKTNTIDDQLQTAFGKANEEYKNITFNFKSGPSVDDIESDIVSQKEKYGDAFKLVIIDYLEKVRGPFSDATANSAYVASRLTDLAREYDVCLILLLQPQKSAGDPGQELLSMRKIKGASVIEQDLRVILTMWRPGFNPKNMSQDKYLSLAVVKNNMGELCQIDFHWNGIDGNIRELTMDETDDLKELLKSKAQEAELARRGYDTDF